MLDAEVEVSKFRYPVVLQERVQHARYDNQQFPVRLQKGLQVAQELHRLTDVLENEDQKNVVESGGLEALAQRGVGDIQAVLFAAIGDLRSTELMAVYGGSTVANPHQHVAG